MKPLVRSLEPEARKVPAHVPHHRVEIIAQRHTHPGDALVVAAQAEPGNGGTRVVLQERRREVIGVGLERHALTLGRVGSSEGGPWSGTV